MTSYRPAAVERMAGEYVVVGVGRDDEPMVRPTIDMRIRRPVGVRTPNQWLLEISGETYVYTRSLIMARIEASTRAFALDEVPTRPVVTPGDAAWPHALRAYVAGVFRGKFPAASIGVVYDEDDEEWRVSVDGALWSQHVGSDDDEFCLASGGGSTVTFPIPSAL